MKFKLDENLGSWAARPLRDEKHDVSTVLDQGMSGKADPDLAAVCAAENRCLVTMDLGFANPVEYPPKRYAGIVVMRPKGRTGKPALRQLSERLAQVVRENDPAGKLWILTLGHLREYRPET